MKDNYPTRKDEFSSFIDRQEPTAIHQSDYLDDEQFNFYQKNGFLIIKDFFDSKPEMAELETGLVTVEPLVNKKRSVTGVHKQEPFASLSTHHVILDIVRSLLGGGVYIHQSRINFKFPFVGSGWHWHSDFETWHAQDGMPSMRCLSVMIPLTSNTEFNGPLLVIPGSHEMFWSSPKAESEYDAMSNFADQKEGVPDEAAMKEFLFESKIEKIVCEPGDIVLFDCNIIHGSVANMTAEARTNLFFVYNSIYNKLEKPFSASVERPEEMGARLNTQEL